MRTISWKAKGSKSQRYDCTIKVIDKTKTIVWIDCECWNFCNQRIYKSGLFADQRFYSKPCKHLKLGVDTLIAVGYELKEPKQMRGTDKCTAELKRFLIDRSKGSCECGCGKKGEEVHRKVPRTNGGKYNKDNCVLLNKECHRAITYQPWQSSPGKNRNKESDRPA